MSRGGRPDRAGLAPTLPIASAAGGTHLFQEPGINEHVTALARIWFGRWLAAMPTREARHVFQKS
jgi:hypothetical protein